MHACVHETDTFTWNPADLVARVFATARRSFEGHIAAQKLMSLDDHLLRNIGVSRDDVEHLVRTGRTTREHEDEPGYRARVALR